VQQKLHQKNQRSIDMEKNGKNSKVEINIEEEESTVDAQEESTTSEENTEETVAEEVTEEAPKAEGWEGKYNEVNDRFLRLYSEFDNYRKRTAKEKLETVKNASAVVISDLLPILDDFERAIKANEDATDVDGLKEGFTLIQQKMKRILETKGLKPMDSNGETFNTDIHEALTNVPAPSDDMKGKVIDVIEPGYYLNDTVIRFAKVVVGN
jgi:molecular chaperone GrpE